MKAEKVRLEPIEPGWFYLDSGNIHYVTFDYWGDGIQVWADAKCEKWIHLGLRKHLRERIPSLKELVRLRETPGNAETADREPESSERDPSGCVCGAEDKARLDWYIHNVWAVGQQKIDGVWRFYIRAGMERYYGETPREAIDNGMRAARAAQGGQDVGE